MTNCMDVALVTLIVLTTVIYGNRVPSVTDPGQPSATGHLVPSVTDPGQPLALSTQNPITPVVDPGLSLSTQNPVPPVGDPGLSLSTQNPVPPVVDPGLSLSTQNPVPPVVDPGLSLSTQNPVPPVVDPGLSLSTQNPVPPMVDPGLSLSTQNPVPPVVDPGLPLSTPNPVPPSATGNPVLTVVNPGQPSATGSPVVDPGLPLSTQNPVPPVVDPGLPLSTQNPVPPMVNPGQPSATGPPVVDPGLPLSTQNPVPPGHLIPTVKGSGLTPGPPGYVTPPSNYDYGDWRPEDYPDHYDPGQWPPVQDDPGQRSPFLDDPGQRSPFLDDPGQRSPFLDDPAPMLSTAGPTECSWLELQKCLIPVDEIRLNSPSSNTCPTLQISKRCMQTIQPFCTDEKLIIKVSNNINDFDHLLQFCPQEGITPKDIWLAHRHTTPDPAADWNTIGCDWSRYFDCTDPLNTMRGNHSQKCQTWWKSRRCMTELQESCQYGEIKDQLQINIYDWERKMDSCRGTCDGLKVDKCLRETRTGEDLEHRCRESGRAKQCLHGLSNRCQYHKVWDSIELNDMPWLEEHINNCLRLGHKIERDEAYGHQAASVVGMEDSAGSRHHTSLLAFIATMILAFVTSAVWFWGELLFI